MAWEDFVMARLSKDVVVVSQPVRTFPNGDYFYLELVRKNSRYECVVRMFCSGKSGAPVPMARAEGKTIQEAEEKCHQTALDRCPSFPKPPYFSRSKSTRRLEPVFKTVATSTTKPAKAKAIKRPTVRAKS
jgi:hypothetical protein